MLPLAGSIAYLVLELLPEFGGSKTGRKTRKKIQTIVNPDKDIKTAAFEFSMSDTTENSMRLAQELLNKELFDEAKALYQKCLKGVHEHDPYMMYGLARAEFGLKSYSTVKSLLDDLIKFNPDFKNADAHLLYARTLENLGEIDAARTEYDVLEHYFPGPEACYHYAKLLESQGDQSRARNLREKIIEIAKRSGSHYNDIHKKWIRLATAENRN